MAANSTYEFIVEMWYKPEEARGVASLVAAGMLSLISVTALLVVMAISAYRTLYAPEEHLFIRTHVAAYFISLLLCDLTQSIGSIINIAWIRQMGVTFGPLCVAQGAIKQAGNVGTALWSFVIALHTFCLLFLRLQIRDWVCYATLISTWLFLGFILILGPGVLESKERGPFYGISGYWCWMTSAYPTERITLEYLFMFASAGISFVLYSLVFLRLRGNVTVTGWAVRFQRRDRSTNFAALTGGGALADPSRSKHLMTVARQMLWYPVAYTLLVLPIAATRFCSFAGMEVPFGLTIFAATVFMLSGFVNTVLFTTTRRVIPARSIFPKFIRRPFGGSSFSLSVGSKFTKRSASRPTTEKTLDLAEDDSNPSTPTPRKYDPIVAPFASQKLAPLDTYGQKRAIWSNEGGASTSEVSLPLTGINKSSPAQFYPRPPAPPQFKPSTSSTSAGYEKPLPIPDPNFPPGMSSKPAGTHGGYGY